MWGYVWPWGVGAAALLLAVLAWRWLRPQRPLHEQLSGRPEFSHAALADLPADLLVANWSEREGGWTRTRVLSLCVGIAMLAAAPLLLVLLPVRFARYTSHAVQMLFWGGLVVIWLALRGHRVERLRPRAEVPTGEALLQGDGEVEWITWSGPASCTVGAEALTLSGTIYPGWPIQFLPRALTMSRRFEACLPYYSAIACGAGRGQQARGAHLLPGGRRGAGGVRDLPAHRPRHRFPPGGADGRERVPASPGARRAVLAGRQRPARGRITPVEVGRMAGMGRALGLGLLLLGLASLAVALIWPEVVRPAAGWMLGLGAGAAVLGACLLAGSRSESRCLHEQLMARPLPPQPQSPDTAGGQPAEMTLAGMLACLPPEPLLAPLAPDGRPLMTTRSGVVRWQHGSRRRLFLGAGLVAMVVAALLATGHSWSHAVGLVIAGAGLFRAGLLGRPTLWIGPVGQVDLGKPLARYRGRLHLGRQAGEGVLEICERGLAFNAGLHGGGEEAVLTRLFGQTKACYGCLPYYALQKHRMGSLLQRWRLTLEYQDADGDACEVGFSAEQGAEALSMLEETLKRYRTAG